MRRSSRNLLVVAFGTALAFFDGACAAIWGFDDVGLAPADGGTKIVDAADVTSSDGRPATSDAATSPPPPSCASLEMSCGPNGTVDCCDSPLVPGGAYSRSYDGVIGVDGHDYTDRKYLATVSDFRLDRFELTVGRFRAFAAEFPTNLPVAGAGRNSNDHDDPGWDESWSAFLPASREALVDAIESCTDSWTDDPSATERRPMPCITWYEAFAFCAWDGGRLPSEAEWNYAAAGGGEQRARPWSSPPMSTAIDSTFAVYAPAEGTADVGSRSPKGDGKWGHADLVGNVFEWVRDIGVDPQAPYAINPCNDCQDQGSSDDAIVRGASWNNTEDALYSSFRQSGPRTLRGNYVGVRCVRAP